MYRRMECPARRDPTLTHHFLSRYNFFSVNKTPVSSTEGSRGNNMANAREIEVYAAGATKEVVIRVAPGFTKATGIEVVPVYDTVGKLRDRVLQGEKPGVAMLSSAALDTLQ